MTDLLEYFLRITPGIVLITVTFLITPARQVLFRIVLLIMGFILMRDALTPLGLWQFGITGSAIWLRFTPSQLVLGTLGLLSAGASVLLLGVRELRTLVRWGALADWRTYGVGIGVGLLVVCPFLLLSLGIPLEERGGPVPFSALPVLLFFALVGNFLEELMFRGFLQSHFEQRMSSVRAALLSGLSFGIAHVYLASTVTDLGWPLLAFVLLEGLACAFVYRRFGLMSAALVHGTVIFLLAGGLV